jgi:hypothetical protein
MSDNYPSEPYPVTGTGPTGIPAAPTAPPVYGTTTTPSTEGGSASSGTADTAKEQAAGVAGTAKEQAANVGSTAKESAKDVAGTAKDEAGKVATTAKRQAKDLYDETRSQLTEQAGTQQKKVASGLHSLSDELRDMSDASSGSGVAADLVSQAATRAGSVATWLEDRDPGSLLTEVKDFARRKPGTFIAVAAVAGIVAGRLTRSLVSEAKDSADDDASTSTSTTSAPETVGGFVPPAPTTPVYGSQGFEAPATGVY